MAAAAAQMQGLVVSSGDPGMVKWANAPLFGDIPTSDGKIRLEKALQWLSSIQRGGSNLGMNVKRQDPGVGGVGNATVQAQHADRNSTSREAVLSLIESSSNLYTTCSNAIFVSGADIWDYLDSADIVYLRIADDEAQEHIRKIQLLTIKDLPVDQQNDINQCLHFKAKIQAYNPMKHPNMNITNGQKITIFCNGLHPDAKIEALKMKNNLAQAAANGCCFPAVHAAGHPQAGAVHPQAGQLSLDKLALYVNKDFTMKVRAGLKGPPGAQLAVTDESLNMADVASDLPVEQDAFLFASWTDLQREQYSDFASYSINILGRESSRFRTCRNCGGIEHFAEKDGVAVCPTPKGAVPIDMLRRIRYPFGVNAWRFGRGKGKGIGKGKGSGKGGRGRGDGYWAWHEPEPAQPAASEEHVNYVTDDYDGWNAWE